jgi:hypothetical protein
MYGLKECRTGYSGYATGLKTEEVLFDLRQWQEIILFCKNVQTGSGAHPASFVKGYRN